eukprot:753961-Hanusia_phi.AAC.2
MGDNEEGRGRCWLSSDAVSSGPTGHCAGPGSSDGGKQSFSSHRLRGCHFRLAHPRHHGLLSWRSPPVPKDAAHGCDQVLLLALSLPDNILEELEATARSPTAPTVCWGVERVLLLLLSPVVRADSVHRDHRGDSSARSSGCNHGLPPSMRAEGHEAAAGL